MMVFTIIFVATIIIGALYFLVVRSIPWPTVSYILMVGVGIACLFLGNVHFMFIGIEVAGLGSLLVWIHFQFSRKSVRHYSKREV
jgi:hypothetical protein